jgi:hypothetical protein
MKTPAESVLDSFPTKQSFEEEQNSFLLFVFRLEEKKEQFVNHKINLGEWGVHHGCHLAFLKWFVSNKMISPK